MPVHTIQCDIVSAERVLFSAQVQCLIITSEQGELGIYPGHAPLLATLSNGAARIQLPSEQEEVVYLSGGFVEVQPYKVTVLADVALRLDELHEEAALAAKQHAEEHLGNNQPDLDHQRAMKELNEALTRLRVINKYSHHNT
ncbi:F0F1 ATP synthase subunit epsilon [Maribrevibacterium harenarium]|uniref:ATP synthase epsilon chain n=1 Tax=Maribrevibacterium harenarium TaxID=2589817 RepID=A0A501X4E7_9GAMM|nr:F0F1 ATP synthase subunit epsilon [Maribrevibacterium harenarium]